MNAKRDECSNRKNGKYPYIIEGLLWLSAQLLFLGLAIAAAPVAAGVYIFGASFDEQPEGPYSLAESARFLTQATYGPTLPEIERLMDIGYDAWLDEQMTSPASLQAPFLDDSIQSYLNAGQPVVVGQQNRQEIWWENSLYGEDQLRQRTAFALSQIFVVSDRNGVLDGVPTVLADYYDLLAQNAFGNYRDLLEEITLSPAMGYYLSMFRNRKPDTVLNIRPDENFAREIQQLFSIGLEQLNPDGTPVDGDDAAPGIQPISTYDQDVIRGFAHVFTGWNYSTCAPPFLSGSEIAWWVWDSCVPGDADVYWQLAPGWRTPLVPWGEGTVFGDVYHAWEGSKQLLNYPGVALAGGILPPGGTARQNLEVALDNIFHHPNVGPFIGRLLIQRFTTSNPTASYVARVAGVFNNNGEGVRGDLGAVVRAILLDPEARKPDLAPTYFGKLREPLLRLTQLWRALDASSQSGLVLESYPEVFSGQAALRSPSVFNFYLPYYRLPGEIAEAGLDSPEFQIATDTYLVRFSNALTERVYSHYQGNDAVTWDPVRINLTPLLALADDVPSLLDRLDLLFMSRRMSNEMFEVLRAHAEDFDLSVAPPADLLARRELVQDLIWLIITSPEYVVEQ